MSVNEDVKEKAPAESGFELLTYAETVDLIACGRLATAEENLERELGALFGRFDNGILGGYAHAECAFEHWKRAKNDLWELRARKSPKG